MAIGVRPASAVWAALVLAACGDEGGSVWDAQDGGAGTGGAADGDGDGDGHGEGDDGEGTDGADDDDGGGGPKLDVGPPAGDGGGLDDCGCELNYIWIANSPQGTVSKIDTRSLEEEGRYLTRADGNGNPSRTSVNLAGDVAVANRYGGLTKIYAEPEDCVDLDGDGVITTSTGKDDVLAWDEEECRAWYTPFPTTNQRPVAWTGGTVTPGSCDVSNADVWTVTSANPGLDQGLGGEGGVIAYLVDGETGAIEETVPVPDFNGSMYGAYGGAVDADGNLWFSSLGIALANQLARIDADTLQATVYAVPPDVAPYGITVDHTGRPWLSSVFGSGAGRFDPTTETWGFATGFYGGAGLTEGPDGRWMYVTAGTNVHAVDVETFAHGGVWASGFTLKGVGFDADGYLWAVSQGGDGSDGTAYKVDVDTMSVVDTYDGLDNPYTYSDMTGSALSTVNCPPEG